MASNTKFSEDPTEQLNREILINFLDSKVDNVVERDRLLGLANWTMGSTIHFSQDCGYYVLQNNGRRSYLTTYLKNKWRNNISEETKQSNLLRNQDPERKAYLDQLKIDSYEAIPDMEILYLASLIPNSYQIPQRVPKWEDLIVDPTFQQKIYPGIFTSKSGAFAMRHHHFAVTRDNSEIHKFLSDPANQPATCLELLAILCESQFDKEQAEGFIMVYGKEYNRLHPENPIYIITETAGIHPRNERAAIQLARDGIPLFKIAQETDPVHPPYWSTFEDFEDLKKFPYSIKPSNIIERWISGTRPDNNLWGRRIRDPEAEFPGRRVIL